MTDHESSGDDAAERNASELADGGALQQLTQRVEELESLLRTVAWGVTRETDELKAALDELEDRVPDPRPATRGSADLVDQPADDGGGRAETRAQAWIDRATAEEWSHLTTWVDWLTATYDVAPSRAVPPCWPAHRGVSEELAGLWLAWRAAVATLVGDDPDEVEPNGERDDVAGVADPTDALIAWHDRWLHPCLARLHSEYQVRECIDGHKAPRPGRRTDRDLLPSAGDDTPSHPPRKDATPCTAG